MPKSSPEKKFLTRGDRVIGLILLTLAVLFLLALLGFHHFDWPAGGHIEEIKNPLQILGASIAWFLVNFTFGRFGSFVFPVIFSLWGIKRLANLGKPLRITILLLFWGFWLGWGIQLISLFYKLYLPQYQWGLLSGEFAHFLCKFTGFTGAWILTLLTLLLLIEFTFGLKIPQIGLNWFREIPAIFANWGKKFRSETAKEIREIRRSDVQVEKELEVSPPLPQKEKPQIAPVPTVEKAEKLAEGAPQETYTFPPLELLSPSEEGQEVSDEELRALALSLEKRLEEFGVEAKVVSIHPGPIITRFDLQPAPGVKVSSIVALQDDLALSMQAPRSLRILAPIPGQPAVGVEVPNKLTRTVVIRTVIESEAFQKSASKLTIALGVDTSGEPYVTNLQEMPHLLVAGTTGSGKSVCLNSILASILFRATPDEVRLALVDPKKLELSLYMPLLEHHLITPPGVKEPVVTEAEDALKLMKSLELEMQERYRRLSVGGYRSLEEYNQNRKESRLPYLILMIDELADLMMTAGSAIESPIARLAQMGRAIGIHLILATQRPSVDVLTGIIKANFPCRIAFQVASKVDSRTILDANGAETLLGKGDMLFLPPGVGIPKRLHGSLITTEEIEAIVEHISKQPVFAERVELPDPLQEVSRPLELTPENKDELFDEAARLIAIHQQGSVSLLQRKLKIGYARAARLIDQMEAAGIVGPFDGSKARKVLVSEDWLPEMGIRKDERGMINNE